VGRIDDVTAFAELSEGDRTSLLDRLATAAAAGDLEALDHLLTLVDKHRLARGAIRRLVVNDTDADDVAQDVLIKVSAGIGSYRGEAKFTTWLHTVARNAAITHLRRSRDDVTLGDDDRQSPTQRVSSLIAGRDQLRSAIDALPDHYRAVILLRDVDGHDYASIADQLDIEVGTVRSRLARGRAMVARTIEVG